MEAAEEAARQLRLRDLAGLIVIDFIDMDDMQEQPRRREEAEGLPEGRPRPRADGQDQPFGLMEISRQRRRAGVLEATTHVCAHCAGTGRVRSVESSALPALRAHRGAKASGGEAERLHVRVPRRRRASTSSTRSATP